MVEIAEGSLHFKFADGWDAIKFDDTSWHKQSMKSQLKAMDILARNQQQHWWIEIKDCKTFETENLPRLSPTESSEVQKTRVWVAEQGWKPAVSVTRKKLYIVDEILEKLRDTLFSVSIASRENHTALAAFWHPVSKPEKLTIVLLLTWDIADFKRFARLLHQKLTMALQPYGLQGLVVNELTPVPGLNCIISRIV